VSANVAATRYNNKTPTRLAAILAPLFACAVILIMTYGPSYFVVDWLVKADAWNTATYAVVDLLPFVLLPPTLMIACHVLGVSIKRSMVLRRPTSNANKRALNIAGLVVVAFFVLKVAALIWTLDANPKLLKDLIAERGPILTGLAWCSFVVTAALLAPIAEETIFRGFLMSRLAAARVGSVAAIWISAICFGVLHFEAGLLSVVFASCIGLILGRMRVKTGSTLPGIVLHVGWNASTLILYAAA
jgi:membrane protease YdiL (CAAX protease family)